MQSEMPGDVRVIYISDVSGNIGLHDMDAVLDAQPSETIRRTTISALGVGGFNYDDVAMETQVNRANGTYHYVGSDTLLEQFKPTRRTCSASPSETPECRSSSTPAPSASTG